MLKKHWLLFCLFDVEQCKCRQLDLDGDSLLPGHQPFPAEAQHPKTCTLVCIQTKRCDHIVMSQVSIKPINHIYNTTKYVHLDWQLAVMFLWVHGICIVVWSPLPKRASFAGWTPNALGRLLPLLWWQGGWKNQEFTLRNCESFQVNANLSVANACYYLVSRWAS